MTSSHEELQQLSKSQTRHQIVLMVLSVAMVASTIMTWMLVSATREANEIQKQLLTSQQADPAPTTTVKRPSAAPAVTKTSAAARRSPSLSAARKRSSPPRAETKSTPRTQLASTHTLSERQGRQ